MADRKVRSVTFKMPFNMTPKELKKLLMGRLNQMGLFSKIWDMENT